MNLQFITRPPQSTSCLLQTVGTISPRRITMLVPSKQGSPLAACNVHWGGDCLIFPSECEVHLGPNRNWILTVAPQSDMWHFQSTTGNVGFLPNFLKQVNGYDCSRQPRVYHTIHKGTLYCNFSKIWWTQSPSYLINSSYRIT